MVPPHCTRQDSGVQSVAGHRLADTRKLLEIAVGDERKGLVSLYYRPVDGAAIVVEVAGNDGLTSQRIYLAGVPYHPYMVPSTGRFFGFRV